MIDKTEIWITHQDRRFIIKFENGQPRSIKERKVHAEGRPWEAKYNAPVWHHSQALRGLPLTFVTMAQREAQA